MVPGYTRYAPAPANPRWLFVAGRSFVAAVSADTVKPVLDALWRLAQSDHAPIESIVGAFPLTGEHAVRSFAVVSLAAIEAASSDTTATAVVRGGSSVDIFSVGGSRRFSAGGVEPWVLADFRSVAGIVLGGGDHPTGEVPRRAAGGLPLASGVVEGELLAWSLAPIEDMDPAAGAASSDDASAAEDPDETIIRSRYAPVPRAGSAHTTDLESEFDDDTILRSRAPRRSIPAEDLITFRVGAGEPRSLDAPAFVGREPAPPRIALGVSPLLVTVESPTQVVSSTHVQLQQVGDAVVVTDLRSTNGTFVISPGIDRLRMRPGESRVVLPGTTVDIGDGNIIEIIPAGGYMIVDSTGRGSE
ncbi:MAG: betaine-aldehyde dehydrogenase [Microbacteriaceae bacterium]|nr:betaine-aldehyde dehydrogenase [Microbacteriaceae bacterium]